MKKMFSVAILLLFIQAIGYSQVVLKNEEKLILENENGDNDNTHIRRAGGNALRIFYANAFAINSMGNQPVTFRNSADEVYAQIHTNGSSYFMGRLGINGITSPSVPLSVKGTMRASFDTGETKYIEMAHGGGNAYIRWAGDGNLDFRKDGVSGNLMTLEEDGTLRAGMAVYARHSGNNYLRMGHGGANAYLDWNGSGDLVFRRNNTDLMTLKQNGTLGLGTTNIPTGYKFAVNGKIITEGVRVELEENWPDYVFAPSYQLMPLSEVEQYIAENKHLPDVPSADEVAKEGIDVATMDAKLLQKIEELTLYTIEQQKALEQQQRSYEELKKLTENNNG